MKLKAILTAALLAAATGASAEKGAAKLKGTAEGSKVAGIVLFEDTKEGLKVSADLSGLPEGEHGFHIHEFGACEDLGKAAGGHYNPKAVKHGHALKDGIKGAHAGDLGNILVGIDGKAKLEVVLPKLSLSGDKLSVGGRAVVVHEKADDFGQPAGNAGGRIGCGAILVTAP